MQALFVHGMGRTPLSGWPMLRHLKLARIQVSTFGYMAGVEAFARIEARLCKRLAALASKGEYIVIGHSLGGLLLRAAVNSLHPNTQRPEHVFLLGSPVQASRLAHRLQRKLLYRLLTGDCGQMLASAERMSAVAPPNVAVTAIAGTRGLRGCGSPFYGESNDGVVSLSEVSATWLGEPLQVPVVHTLLPASKHVAELILARVSQRDAA